MDTTTATSVDSTADEGTGSGVVGESEYSYDNANDMINNEEKEGKPYAEENKADEKNVEDEIDEVKEEREESPDSEQVTQRETSGSPGVTVTDIVHSDGKGTDIQIEGATGRSLDLKLENIQTRNSSATSAETTCADNKYTSEKDGNDSFIDQRKSCRDSVEHEESDKIERHNVTEKTNENESDHARKDTLSDSIELDRNDKLVNKEDSNTDTDKPVKIETFGKSKDSRGDSKEPPGIENFSETKNNRGDTVELAGNKNSIETKDSQGNITEAVGNENSSDTKKNHSDTKEPAGNENASEPNDNLGNIKEPVGNENLSDTKKSQSDTKEPAGNENASEPKDSQGNITEPVGNENLSDTKKNHSDSKEPAGNENASEPNDNQGNITEPVGNENLSDTKKTHNDSKEPAGNENASEPNDSQGNITEPVGNENLSDTKKNHSDSIELAGNENASEPNDSPWNENLSDTKKNHSNTNEPAVDENASEPKDSQGNENLSDTKKNLSNTNEPAGNENTKEPKDSLCNITEPVGNENLSDTKNLGGTKEPLGNGNASEPKDSLGKTIEPVGKEDSSDINDSHGNSRKPDGVENSSEADNIHYDGHYEELFNAAFEADERNQSVSESKDDEKLEERMVEYIKGADFEKDEEASKKIESISSTSPTESGDYWNENLLFYQNKINSKPFPGAKIEEMLQWKGDYAKLERTHSYIQWLFPIPESSGMNYSAQPLQEYEAKVISEDETLRTRVLEAYKMMLDFYGMNLVSDVTGEVQRGTNFKERYAHLNRSIHNHYRITRILKALGELGLEHLQAPWLEHILKEATVNQTLSGISQNCIEHWLGAIKDEEQHVRLYILLTELNEQLLSGHIKAYEESREEQKNPSVKNVAVNGDNESEEFADQIAGKSFAGQETSNSETVSKDESDRELDTPLPNAGVDVRDADKEPEKPDEKSKLADESSNMSENPASFDINGNLDEGQSKQETTDISSDSTVTGFVNQAVKDDETNIENRNGKEEDRDTTENKVKDASARHGQSVIRSLDQRGVECDISNNNVVENIKQDGSVSDADASKEKDREKDTTPEMETEGDGTTVRFAKENLRVEGKQSEKEVADTKDTRGSEPNLDTANAKGQTMDEGEGNKPAPEHNATALEPSEKDQICTDQHLQPRSDVEEASKVGKMDKQTNKKQNEVNSETEANHHGTEIL